MSCLPFYMVLEFGLNPGQVILIKRQVRTAIMVDKPGAETSVKLSLVMSWDNMFSIRLFLNKLDKLKQNLKNTKQQKRYNFKNLRLSKFSYFLFSSQLIFITGTVIYVWLFSLALPSPQRLCEKKDSGKRRSDCHTHTSCHLNTELDLRLITSPG